MYALFIATRSYRTENVFLPTRALGRTLIVTSGIFWITISYAIDSDHPARHSCNFLITLRIV